MERQANTNGIISNLVAWALFITFMVLKLCNVINWSWWWVTAPLWITYGVGILAIIIMAIIFGVVSAKRKKERKAHMEKVRELLKRDVKN